MNNKTGQAPQGPAGIGFYAALFGGLALVIVIAVVSVTFGGLPGTRNSPSATVKGETITGKSAANQEPKLKTSIAASADPAG
ncbi:MAG: hypothetical protein K2Y27_28170 [Xanthobacteraceae bacterium]|nr:hypothetical protein [Xanthobacteraceae bacterium]